MLLTVLHFSNMFVALYRRSAVSEDFLSKCLALEQSKRATARQLLQHEFLSKPAGSLSQSQHSVDVIVAYLLMLYEHTN